MALMVLDAQDEERLKAERAASGADRFDEVWEGVYMMAPLANNEHQFLQARLTRALQDALGPTGPELVQAGANVSDREDGWTQNYRCPDVVVVLPGSVARDCGTHWCGGPDFCVEIISPGDRTRDKLDFYAHVGVRELLLVDRNPWGLELYRLANKQLELVGRSDLANAPTLMSIVVPVSFRLVVARPRPKIELTHHDGAQRWMV
ncbi:MAG TPA: Uma2 family endonuclease [Tepidisphaeraceae bacterium]|nr:Uma2 family endonuclease [Tepidisphaeraceae bacterium]